MDEQRAVLTVREAAVLLGISKGSAYRAVREGMIPPLRINRRIVIPRVKLERWLAGAGKGAQHEGYADDP